MKCVNCNKEIPDSSVICPYCNGPVDPVVTAAPVFNTPEVDNTPVITSKSDMVVNNSPMVAAPGNEVPVSAQEEITPVNVTLPVTPTEPQLPTDQNNLLVETAAQPIVTPEMMETPAEQTAVENASASDVPVQEPTESIDNIPMTVPVEELIETPSEVEPQTVEAPAPTSEPKAKINLPIKKIIIIVLILAILGGGAYGLYYYLSAYKSADKRLATFTNKVFEAPLFSAMANLNNKKIELSSGEYEFTLDLDYDETKLMGTLFGKYGIDTKNKNSNFTFNLKNVKLNDIQLITEKNPLSVEVASDADRIYLLLQNFFDKYLYIQVPDIGNVYDAIEQNDFDYTYFIKTVKETFIKAVNELDLKQTNGSETINGESKKANIITIEFTNDNIKKFNEVIRKELKNNSKFVTQLSKLTSTEETDVKARIENMGINEGTKDSKLNFKLLTTVGGEFIGAKLGNNDMHFELTLDGNTYKIVQYADGKKQSEFIISETLEKAAATNTRDGIIDFTIFIEDTAYKSKVTYKLVENVNPKVEKVNTKNSINFENISMDDMNTIVNNVRNFGMFGTLIDSMGAEDYILPDTKASILSSARCSQVTNCVKNADTATCKYCVDDNCTQTENIICPLS